ncbi:hypothetical protein KL866_16260 [Alteromonas sp. ALT199]|uniref:hypothetical protein n=1 Tax=unclassified Alteromonas TaxID=2614992 RepID=UPI001BE701ED|nr:hypothetical protein [Alteromonas sp. ALT199]MBT3136621.1 hypothetical protein [Alteromonas sp. ALT199]
MMALFGKGKSKGLPAAALAIALSSAIGCAATKEVELHKAITNGTSASQKQTIENTISNWFGGVSISVADNVFSSASSITIERKAKVDSRGLPVEGRHDNPVYSFTLLSDGKQCLLRNDQTGELAKLENVKCYPNHD